ncbi:hypothetical protein AXF42_Ash017902 [Apostasia shenzhenica]|uniref:Senescence domain-containing protein n=1 Tax=Apostasia shenzhenica TaxID=1088818 RepID=A0A2I0AY99_9ASPA|nr:hypothetical protein AXF42_Ash017902 [Apostasia shenzhenica]
MADEDATNKLRARMASDGSPRGTDTELIAISGAQPSKLFALCGDRFGCSRAFRAGKFSVRVIGLAGGCHVAMAICVVEDHQWMLARDSMALRVGERAFVFALPGVLYGLSLPDGCSEAELERLEETFARYSAYQNLAVREAETKPESETWSLPYEKLKKLAEQSCSKIAAAGPPAGEAAVDIAAAKIQRAVRMSAAVKLTSRALLSGALAPADHLNVALTTPPAAAPLPSVWMLAALLDAIETGVPPAATMFKGSAEGFWWLRKEGLEFLMGVVRAYGLAAKKRPRVDVALAAPEKEDRGDPPPASPAVAAAAETGN